MSRYCVYSTRRDCKLCQRDRHSSLTIFKEDRPGIYPDSKVGDISKRVGRSGDRSMRVADHYIDEVLA